MGKIFTVLQVHLQDIGKANNDVQLTIEGKGYKGKAQIIENQDEILVSYSFFLNIFRNKFSRWG